MKAPRLAALVLAAGAAAAMLAACGSSPTTTSSTPPSAPSSPSAPGSSALTATITKNWETFFKGTTPVDTRISLLENGSSFPKDVLAPNALSKGASAKVSKISGVTASTAEVEYSVYLGSTDALPNQHGTAVYQGGTWKVGFASFCALLTLENSGNAAKDPPICKTA